MMSNAPQTPEKMPFPRHLFMRDPRSQSVPKSPAVLIATGSLDYTQPIIPQVMERLSALQTPTHLNPSPTPVQNLMTDTDLLEGLLEANRQAMLQSYNQELQSTRKMISLLSDELEATKKQLKETQARVERVEGVLFRILNGISETVLSSWALPITDIAYMRC